MTLFLVRTKKECLINKLAQRQYIKENRESDIIYFYKVKTEKIPTVCFKNGNEKVWRLSK